MKLILPPPGTLVPNDEHDPLPYYYRPLVGALFRHRLTMGLSLIPAKRDRLLEVGVGSGILVTTLTAHCAEYTGTDLVLAPNLDRLVSPPCRATFHSADLLDPGSLPENQYDVVVCLSVLEHIADCDGAARALARVLAPGGTLVAGLPMVNAFMAKAFRAIGFANIEDHHVSSPKRVTAALSRVLRPAARVALPPLAPTELALYQCGAWVKD
jgi:ubiquinone/menaquinone biosynthesis C-methylase UbiE